MTADTQAFEVQTGRPVPTLDAAQLLMHVRDGVVATDVQGLVIAWNPSAARMLGWSHAEAIGQPLSALIVPAHADALHESGLEPYLRTGAARGLDGLLEIEVLRRDGRPVTLELSLFTQPGQGGEVSGMLMRDVSERQSTQKAVRQSEARYRSLVEHLGEGMAVIQDGRVAFWNARALEIVRVDADRVAGADYLQWLHPDDRPLAARRQRERQRGSPVPRRYALRRLDDDGAVRWLDVHATAVPWEGRPATMVFFSDITAAKATTEALRASEERYRSVVEHLSEGMIVIQDEVVVYANPRAAEIAGMPLAQMQKIGFLTRIHPDDQAMVLERQRRRLAGEHPPAHYELRLLLPDGVVRWIAIGVAVVPWGGKPAALTFFSDVTERKQMLEEVRVSEERLRAVVEHAGEGTLVVIELDKPVFVNARALEIMRMSREELDRLGYLHLVHPDDRPMMLERRRRRLAGDKVVGRYELRLLDGDGSVRWIEMGTTIVPWSGQRATLTFFNDITDRKMMLEAMHRSEERYRAVVEHVGEGMVVVQNGIFVFVNQRALQIARRTREQVIGHSFVEQVHPDDQAMVAELQRRRLAGEPAPSRYETRLRHHDGSSTWIEIGVTLVPWEGKSASLGFFSDVSHRKQLEARLQGTLAERETILENSLVGIAFLTQDGTLRWANHAMARIFGGERATRADRLSTAVQLQHVFPTPAAFRNASAMIESRMREQRSFEGELQMRRRDGTLFWASITGKAVNASDPDAGAIWTVLDITDRKRAEDDIRAALARQQELNVLRSRFVSMTSHEFRTPLATILSSAELLDHYGDRMPDAERREVLDGIVSGVQRMTGMLDRVLLIGQADAQMLECRPEVLDLHALCQRCVQEARSQHPARAGEIVLDYACSREHGAFDEKLLRHVLDNLLSNAVKYSPAGGPVRMRVADEDGRWRFEVSDQGIGIPVQEQAHLFESFHRASNVGGIPGTGLGLAIVKKAVEVHGGSIALHNVAGGGCCFRVVL